MGALAAQSVPHRQNPAPLRTTESSAGTSSTMTESRATSVPRIDESNATRASRWYPPRRALASRRYLALRAPALARRPPWRKRAPRLYPALQDRVPRRCPPRRVRDPSRVSALRGSPLLRCVVAFLPSPLPLFTFFLSGNTSGFFQAQSKDCLLAMTALMRIVFSIFLCPVACSRTRPLCRLGEA